MPITEEQRIERKNFIGASDVPAIMGQDPYRDIADIWCSKTMDMPAKATASLTAGTILEQSVIAWAEEELGLELERDARFIAGRFAANCDAVNRENCIVVEAKTCAIVGYSAEMSEFGEPGTDQIPTRVILQVQTQMYCAGPDYVKAYVPVLIGQRGFNMYVVERNEPLIEEIVAAGERFWKSVEDGVCPGELPSSALQYIARDPLKEVEVDETLMDRYTLAQELVKQANENMEKVKDEMIRALGDAEIGRAPQGIVSYLQQTRKEYTVPPAMFRVLRMKRAKQ